MFTNPNDKDYSPVPLTDPVAARMTWIIGQAWNRGSIAGALCAGVPLFLFGFALGALLMRFVVG